MLVFHSKHSHGRAKNMKNKTFQKAYPGRKEQDLT